MVEKRPFNCAARTIPAHAGKLALEWTYRRLARVFNMLDVDISRGSWGASVRRSVGPFKEVVPAADVVAWQLCVQEESHTMN